MIIPESIALISEGANECASGNHVWSGKSAIFILNPTMKKPKAA
uniref:Uncharacterized protein n=1 Tax=Candidatus Methanophagaceae archaeon ANME-1 ERB6 TaxID=2759912 RepID=A0A7G9Z148_9EURY|nr:hypothetical protein OHMBFCMF_00001 [Methanosarcinales archaeon ANME-1 ERB6]